MDTITHGLLGATVAEAAFRKRLGGRSLICGAVCAMAPDADFVTRIFGEWSSLEHHRGITHSLFTLAALAPIAGVTAQRLSRQGRALDWTWLALASLISHALLDACTPYGTELLSPFTRRRFAFDAISIVDLAYSLPLLVAVVRARLGRHRDKSARFAAIALALTTAYLAIGFVQSRRAIAWATEDLREGAFTPSEIRATPTIGNLLVYRVVARDGRGRYRVAHLSLSAPRTPRWYALRDDEDPLIDAFRRTERGRVFDRVSMGTTHLELRRGDVDFTVRASDLRYGSMRDPRIALWGVDARFGVEGQLVEITRWNRDLDVGAELATLWAFIVGDDAKLAGELAAREGSITSPRCAVPRARARGAR